MSPPHMIASKLTHIVVVEDSGLSGGMSIGDVDAVAAC